MVNSKLTEFKTKIVYPYVNEILMQMNMDFQTQKDELKEGYLEAVKQIFKEVQEYNQRFNKKVAYLSFALLRTNILYGKYIYEAHVYDEDWCFKDYEKIGELDGSYFFRPLKEIEKYLQCFLQALFPQNCKVFFPTPRWGILNID